MNFRSAKIDEWHSVFIRAGMTAHLRLIAVDRAHQLSTFTEWFQMTQIKTIRRKVKSERKKIKIYVEFRNRKLSSFGRASGSVVRPIRPTQNKNKKKEMKTNLPCIDVNRCSAAPFGLTWLSAAFSIPYGARLKELECRSVGMLMIPRYLQIFWRMHNGTLINFTFLFVRCDPFGIRSWDRTKPKLLECM